jgi:hypothetical protein
MKDSKIAVFAAFFAVLVSFLWSCTPTPRYVAVADRVLNGMKTGDITSKEDLTSAHPSSREKYGVSVWAKEVNLEYPEPMILGKIVSFKLVEDSPLTWTYTRCDNLEFWAPDPALQKGKQSFVADMISYDKKLVAEGEKERDRPLAVDDTRFVNGRDSRDANGQPEYTYDTMVGARKLEYTVETDKGFLRVSFVVTNTEVFLIDFYK